MDTTFSTRDLMSAVFIAYNGVKFASGYDAATSCWVFEDPERCRELDLILRNGEAQVEVIRYESTRRALLGMIHARKGKRAMLD